MHVSLELAAEIEAAEADLLRCIAQGSQARRAEHGAWWHDLGAGCAGFGGPHAPINKISGLGFGPLPTGEAFDEVEARFARHGCPSVAEVSTCAGPEWFELLAERGYRLAAFEDVVGIALPAEGCAVDGVEVERVEAGSEREAWFSSLLDGFACPDSQGVAALEDFPREIIDGTMRDMATIADYSTWTARIGGEVAGGGALRTHAQVAHLCGAATRPAFRRRGAQTALVAARLAAASAAGCRLAVTVTQPGSKSQQNMIRQGFERLYARATMVRPSA